MRNIIEKGRSFFVFALIFLFATSCVPSRKLKYFNDINQIQGPVTNPVIKKNIMPYDKLAVKVFSSDANTNQLLNQINTGVTATQGSVTSSYVVDDEGNINFPFVGKINLNGLTPDEASSKLVKELSEYLTVTSVNIQFIEKTVTLVGSVNQQGVYPFTQDKLTIYEALALAGGISQYGDRDNVILVRQQGNKITQSKLNLTNSKIIGSEYYYIMPSDIIVVEPLRTASWYNFNQSLYSLVITFVTSTLLVYSFFH